MANPRYFLVNQNTISSTNISNGTVFLPHGSSTTGTSWIPSNSTTKSYSKKVIANRFVNMISVYNDDDNDVQYSSTPGHTEQELWDVIANVLYSSQHLPAKSPELSNLMYTTSLIAGKLRIRDGSECTIRLPDGGVLRVEKDGSYRIDDEHSKVIYRANRVRDFNSYLNASDKLEDFIRFCGEQGVRQGEMLELPISLFIMWLIVEAARQDHVEEPEQPLLASLKQKTLARCTECGRFMRRALKLKQVNQCRPECFAVACS